MALIKGAIDFGSNFNIGAKGPIDARQRVATIEDLTTVWTKDIPAYKDMVVACMEDHNLYILTADDATNAENWKKIGDVSGDITNLQTQITENKTAINTINGDASTRGSFAKGDADTLTAAKNYTDAVKSELIGTENIADTIKHAEKLATDASDKVDTKIAEEVERANAAYATAAQGTKADAALQSIEKSGDYINVTKKAGNKQTVSLTTQTISGASDTAKGLAEASDVKGYVDNTKTALIGTDKDAATANTIYGAKAAAADAKDAANAKISAVTSKAGDKYVKATTDGTAVTIESIGIDGAIGDAKTALIGTDEDAATVDTIKGAKAAAKAADDKAAAAQTAADSKIKSVTGDTTVIATTTGHAVTVSLKTNNKGNVKFTQDTDGLSANVTIPPATVTGVVADDKFLSLTDKLVGADVSIAYDPTDKKIYLYGKDKTKANAVSSIDCKDFIKDGMLEGSALYNATAATGAVTINGKEYTLTGLTAGHVYIVLVWNTDAAKDAMAIDVTSLIDIYTNGEGLNLDNDNHKFSVDWTKVAKKSDLDTVTGRVSTLEDKVGSAAAGGTAATGLFKEVADNKAAVNAYTVNGKKISNNPVLNGADILVGGESGNKASNISTAIEDLYTKADGVDNNIVSKIAAKIQDLVATNNTSDAAAGITVTVNETDGKVIKPIVKVTPGSVAAGNASVVTGGNVYTAINDAINAALVWTDMPDTA